MAEVAFLWKRDLPEIMLGRPYVITVVTVPDGEDPVAYIKKQTDISNAGRPPDTPPAIFIRMATEEELRRAREKQNG